MEELEIYTALDYQMALERLQNMKEAPSGTFDPLQISWLESAIRNYEEKNTDDLDFQESY